MRIAPSSRTLFALFLFVAAQCLASTKKDWVRLTDCEYVEWKDNDGDSFHVRSGDKEFTVRLYFVDAPETNLKQAERTREQSLHFGITLDETMKAGVKAKERVQELLQRPFVVMTQWANAAGRGRQSRFNCLVEVEGKSLAEILVSEGLARTKGVTHVLPSGEKSSSYVEKLNALEQEAKEKRLGAWATATEQGNEEKD
jgi:endonuclease YncB( thermonuclease family)